MKFCHAAPLNGTLDGLIPPMAAATQTLLISNRVIHDLSLHLNLPGVPRRNSDWFYNFCQANDDLQFERTAEGDIIVRAPSGGTSGDRESEIISQLRPWAKRNGAGRAYGCNTGFELPNGATRAPDASWVRHDRLKRLTTQQREKFLPLCPEFVAEIRSPSDRLPQLKLRAKMEEYLENGVRLGWLIDPANRKVHVYRPGRAVEILNRPQRISGSPELPGFTLQLAEIWEPF
jgi:Uma2 family endonuclease